MLTRLLGFRNYLVLLTLALYVLAFHQLGGALPGWAPVAALLACSLALSRTRLRVKALRGVLSTSEVVLFGALVVLPPLLAGALAIIGNGLRLLLEGPGQIRRGEMALRAAVSGVAAIVATLVYAELGATPQSPEPLGLCGAAVLYLLSAALMDSLEDRLPHWRKLLAAAALGSATMAALFAPLATFFNLILFADPHRALWNIAPLFVVLYAAVEWWLGPLYDDLSSRHEADQVYLPVVEALALAVEAKDSVSSAHLKRVQRYSVEIAKALNCSEEEIRALEFGALLHDIGKIAIPEVLLTKPGRLSPQEFSQMAIHPQVGAEILSAVDFPFPVADLVLCHHENWDGTGYPRRLKGEQIPLTARILSVVDCFDALTSDRPYRPAMSPDRALDIIKTRRGKAFEPKVTDTLLEILPRMEEEFRRERERKTKTRRFKMPRAVETEQTSLTYEERIASLKQTRPVARQRSRADDLTSWYRLLATLGSTLSPQRILDFALPMLKERMPLEEMAVFLADRNGLRPIYCTGPKADLLRNLHVPIGDSPTGWVAGHGETLLNGNPMRECGDLGTMAWLLGLNSALVAPLWEGGRAVGTINLYSKESAVYSHEHAAMLERLTPTLGGVILRSAAYPVRDHSGVDALTGLPNAAQLLTHLASQVDRARAEQGSVSVIYLDLDNFSVVNARLGYSSGDRLLLTLSRAIHDCFENNDLFARVGEDQFAGVLYGISPEKLNSFIKKLKMTVREETHGSFDIPITVSIGAAAFPAEVNSPEALLVLSNQRSFLEKLDRGTVEPQFAALPVPTMSRAG